MNSPKRQPSSQEWAKISRLFDKARLLSLHDQKVFLSRLSCIPVVREELQSLLESHRELENRPTIPIGPKLRAVCAEWNSLEPYPVGFQLGDFTILRLLGSGSFAKVYLAQQNSLGRKVALKVSPNLGVEARMMAPLDHESIVRVFSQSVDPTQTLRFLCMQYVAGPTLGTLLGEMKRQGITDITGRDYLKILDSLVNEDTVFDPTALQDRNYIERSSFANIVLWIGQKLALALFYAHEKGILHLDVKPNNILLNAYGKPLLTDFNVSIQSNDEPLEDAKLLGGTFDYMAPEQQALFTSPLNSVVLDGRADIYALGAVLEEMLEYGKETSNQEIFEILRRCKDPMRENRFSNSQELARNLGAELEIGEVRRALPKDNWLIRVGERYPLITIAGFALLPQLLASLANISYNSQMIIANLSNDQQRLFPILTLFYNGTIYPICVGTWLYLSYSLKRNLQMARFVSPPHLRQIRREILRFPLWMAGIISLGWLSGAVYFPFLLHLLAGPLPHRAFGHFFLSFITSWVIALSYSCLYTQLLCVRVYYPKFLFGCHPIHEVTQEELWSLKKWLWIHHSSVTLVPLLGAALLLSVGASSSSLETVGYLAFALVVIGMFGVLFSMRATNTLFETLQALSGRRISR